MQIQWIRHIHWGKVLLIGFLYTGFSMIVRQLEVTWTMQFFTDPAYYGVWSKIMMPTAGPPPAEFMITSLVLTFAGGIAISLIYYYLRDYLPKGYWRRATFFADILISTSFVFFTLPVYLLFNVPTALLGFWFVSTFVILLLTSLMLVKIMK